MSEASNFITRGSTHAQEAIGHDRKACKSNNPAHFHDAKNAYLRAVEYYLTALKYERNESIKQSLRQKMHSYIDRAEIMKEWLIKYEEAQGVAKQRDAEERSRKEKEKEELDAKKGGKGDSPGVDDGGSGAGGSAGGGGGTKKKKKKKDEGQDENEKRRKQIGGAILTEKPNVKWEDVAGLDAAKGALKEAVIYPVKFPQMFVGKRRPWKGILLYGPPGTGKSYLAKAVATEADAEFFSVSSSDLVSKWQGESERLVKELFEMARTAGKAIIFIDEIDALVSQRGDGESESSRRIKTEFLVQMDGVGKTTDGVLLLGATNIPWGLDDALLRRMERRVYIPLPDVGARAKMFEIHLGDTPHDLNMDDFKELARTAEGYSGSDIAVVVRDAIMQPVRTLQNAQFFKKVQVDGVVMFAPCSPRDPEGVEMNLMSIDPEKVFVPTVCRYDFEVALGNIKPSVGRENIELHEKFTREKGQSGV